MDTPAPMPSPAPAPMAPPPAPAPAPAPAPMPSPAPVEAPKARKRNPAIRDSAEAAPAADTEQASGEPVVLNEDGFAPGSVVSYEQLVAHKLAGNSIG